MDNRVTLHTILVKAPLLYQNHLACAMTFISDDNLEEEILFQRDNYLAPISTEAPCALDSNMPYLTPTLPQVDQITALSNECKGNLAKIYGLVRDNASTPYLEPCFSCVEQVLLILPEAN